MLAVKLNLLVRPKSLGFATEFRTHRCSMPYTAHAVSDQIGGFLKYPPRLLNSTAARLALFLGHPAAYATWHSCLLRCICMHSMSHAARIAALSLVTPTLLARAVSIPDEECLTPLVRSAICLSIRSLILMYCDGMSSRTQKTLRWST